MIEIWDRPCAEIVCRLCGGETRAPQFQLDHCIHWCERCRKATKHDSILRHARRCERCAALLLLPDDDPLTLRMHDPLCPVRAAAAAWPTADEWTLAMQLELEDARQEIARLRAVLQAIAAKECVTPDIHFVQVVDMARKALE